MLLRVSGSGVFGRTARLIRSRPLSATVEEAALAPLRGVRAAPATSPSSHSSAGEDAATNPPPFQGLGQPELASMNCLCSLKIRHIDQAIEIIGGFLRRIAVSECFSAQAREAPAMSVCERSSGVERMT